MVFFENCIAGINKDWIDFFRSEAQKEYFVKLMGRVEEAYRSEIVYPPAEQIFEAFKYCSPAEIKAIFIGQDPYHQPGQAHGLAFSVPKGVSIPPSLKNIFQEMYNDLGILPPRHGNLTKWASQGVLLLNTVLTVKANLPGSHSKYNWEIFTASVIEFLSGRFNNKVFVFWGNHAAVLRKKMVNEKNHLILTGFHPSPLSAYRGFFGCCHFSKINNYLKSKGEKTIDWKLDEDEVLF